MKLFNLKQFYSTTLLLTLISFNLDANNEQKEWFFGNLKLLKKRIVFSTTTNEDIRNNFVIYINTQLTSIFQTH